MYSQKDEESWILRSVAHIPNGTFLDIGAYDGINYSNTRALVERGWSGVMVEAGLQAFLKLLENYADNEKVTLIHAAVGVSTGLTEFWNCPTTFSTTLASNRDKFIHEGFSKKYWMNQIPITELCFYGDFDVVSIDTEGTSVGLLKAFLLSSLGYRRVRCICVEHDGRADEVLGCARIYGYRKIMGNEENIILEAV